MNLSDFHFLRPLWLFALIPAVLFCWLSWQSRRRGKSWEKYVDAALLPHLLSGENQARRWLPVVLLSIVCLLTVIALAGPSWEKQRAPFAADEAALVIVLKVTPTMLSDDVQPTRLERSCQKIHDLLTARAQGKTALIAYSGSSHVVMPFTRDHDLIVTLAGELAPNVLPVEGDVAADAMQRALGLLENERGSILWITDAVAGDQIPALQKTVTNSHTPIQMLAPLKPGSELNALQEIAGKTDADLYAVTPDDADIQKLLAQRRYAGSQADDVDSQWLDAGYWLVPVILLLSLAWFRRGWTLVTLGGED